MQYHEILLIPATGHFGPGVYDPGPNYGTFFELDVVKELLMTIAEELDNDRIRCRTLDLWNGPGMTRSQCGRESDETTISLHVSFGRGEHRVDGRNTTRSWFSKPEASWLAQIMSESVADWAKCSNFHHEMAHPKLKDGFFPHHAVLLEPFSLAFGDPEIYLRRLHDLGKAMAVTIAEFFMKTNQAVRSKPMGAWSNDKKKDNDKVLVSNFLHAVDSDQLQPIIDHGKAVELFTSEPFVGKQQSGKGEKNQGAGNVLKDPVTKHPAVPPLAKSGDTGQPSAQGKAVRSS